jgi:hypothetical protein
MMYKIYKYTYVYFDRIIIDGRLNMVNRQYYLYGLTYSLIHFVTKSESVIYLINTKVDLTVLGINCIIEF